MELLTVGCIGTVVVVAAGVTVYLNRKRRREIAAQERRQADRRQPPVTETRGPFAIDPKTEKVSISGNRILDSGPQDIARKPAPLERHGRPAPVRQQSSGAEQRRQQRERDRQDDERRRSDDDHFTTQRLNSDPVYNGGSHTSSHSPAACSPRSHDSYSTPGCGGGSDGGGSGGGGSGGGDGGGSSGGD